jgi:NOL1/NOP2/fmu family ribosome biogenesis protein
MGLGKREKNFKRYVERHFRMKLPDDIAIFYSRGIRIGNILVHKNPIHGERGYAASDAGFNPTHAFIQNFGHLAMRNVLHTNEQRAKEFAAGKDLSIDLGRQSKYVILQCKGHSIGLGYYMAERKKIKNKTPEKGRRMIVNALNPRGKNRTSND